MKKSRLIILLKSLSKKEVRDFRKYLASPFFNQREDVMCLFEYLVPCIYEESVSLEKADIYHWVYPNEVFDDHKIRLILSFCFKHLERFLTHQAYFEDEVKNKTKLSEVYRKRHLETHFQRSISEADKLLQHSPLRNANYFNNHYQILLERYKISAVQRTDSQNLQELNDNVDIAYFTLKLWQICFSLSHQSVYKTEYRFGMLDQMIEYIESQKLLRIPAIAIYYYCYHAFIHPKDTQYFEKLKMALLEFPDLFPKEEIRGLFLLTINYCIKQLNEGNKHFEKEILDLYKEGLRKNYLLIDGVLSRYTYQNVTTMGLIQKDYDWVAEFNLTYKDKLEKQFREPSFSFNTARLEYARKNYTTVLTLLQKSDYSDVLLNLAAKTIAMKTYFELGEFDLLESHMDAMKNFIRRKKVIGYHKENYSNLIQFVKLLLESRVYDKTKKLKLKKQIVDVKSVAERQWLLAQI